MGGVLGDLALIGKLCCAIRPHALAADDARAVVMAGRLGGFDLSKDFLEVDPRHFIKRTGAIGVSAKQYDLSVVIVSGGSTL